jgi:hypothetical protein
MPRAESTFKPATRPCAAVREVLRRIRRRYRAFPVSERPALDAASLYGATRDEVTTLAMPGCWPIPPRLVARILQGASKLITRARLNKELVPLAEAIVRLEERGK